MPCLQAHSEGWSRRRDKLLPPASHGRSRDVDARCWTGYVSFNRFQPQLGKATHVSRWPRPLYKIYGTKSGNQKLKAAKKSFTEEGSQGCQSGAWCGQQGRGLGASAKQERGGRSRHLRTGWVRGGLHMKEPINQSINQ